MRLIAFALFFCYTVVCAGQQPAYDIQFRVDGWKDTTAYLGNYFSESTYIRDTAKVNSKGEFHFDGKKPLERGVYLLVLGKSKIFEFVIGQQQHFKLETAVPDFVGNMKVTGDPDNKLFFENWKHTIERHKEAEPFVKILQDTTLKEEDKKVAREGYAKVNEKVQADHQELIAKNPKTITALLLKSGIAVKAPEAPKGDSTFQLRWYRQHFFDNFDLADEALTRMPKPVYTQKIDEYLDNLFVPQADTLIKAVDWIIGKAKPNKETYKFAVFTIMRKFQEPKIMGLDAVYVHLYDKYVATGEMDFWMGASHKKNVKEYAERLKKSLLGKTGPNLIMQDENLNPRSMYNIKNKYTILYIYDPDCGHCREETPKVVSFYEKNKAKFDVEVFAVCVDSSLVKMKKYIKEMNMKWVNVNGMRSYVGDYKDFYDAITTPSVFILDSRRKIIGKKIAADDLETFFINYERYLKAHPPEKAGAPKGS
jgi:hypothetical protein